MIITRDKSLADLTTHRTKRSSRRRVRMQRKQCAYDIRERTRDSEVGCACRIRQVDDVLLPLLWAA